MDASKAFRWPDTLKDSAVAHMRHPERDAAELREFALAFYTARHEVRPGMIAERPPSTGDIIYDALVGGIGEHFAWEYDLEAPGWTEEEARFLAEPYFFKCTRSHPATWEDAMAATPPAYARRKLFLGNEPFSRPGKYSDMRFGHRLWEFLARAHSLEPRVLIPARWRGLTAISDYAQARVDGEFCHLLDRIPRRWKFHDCYYLAMVVNELKLRGGAYGRVVAKDLLESIEIAQYEECLVEMRSLAVCATPCFHQGWRNLHKVTNMAQQFIENDFFDLVKPKMPRKTECQHDAIYLSWAVEMMKSKCGSRGFDAVMKLADIIDSGGWIKWTANMEDQDVYK